MTTDRIEWVPMVAAESAGAFALTLAAAGGEVIAAISGGEVSQAARAVAPGLAVMAMIYAVGEVSGAHFNPAVSLAFAARGVFPRRRLPGYWAAQPGGALLAAALLRALFGGVAHVGSTRPHNGSGTALVMETVLTWLLATVILGTGSNKGLVGPNAAIAVGGPSRSAGSSPPPSAAPR